MPKFLLFSASAPPGQDLLLDLYPGATVACSFRKLRAAYTGPCIRVQRSIDSTQTDIGFDSGGLLDTAALVAFAGAGDAFIVTWYHQGVAGFDFNGVNFGPRIVNGGTVETIQGNPCGRFYTSGDRSFNTPAVPGLTGKTNASCFACYQLVTGDQMIISSTPGGTSPIAGVMNQGGGNSESSFGSPLYGINGTALTTYTRQTLYDASVDDVGLRVYSAVELDCSDRNYSRIATCGYVNTSLRPASSALLEFVFYEDTQTANEMDIRNNLNAHYGAF